MKFNSVPKELIIEINSSLMDIVGKKSQLLSSYSLEAALGNQDTLSQYDIETKYIVAAVFKGLILNHPFEDGNKRTAIAYVKKACALNNIESINYDRLKDLAIKIASENGSKLTKEEIAKEIFSKDDKNSNNLWDAYSDESEKEAKELNDFYKNKYKDELKIENLETSSPVEKYNILGEKIEKHDTLNPTLWDDKEEMKPEVKEKLLKVVDKFEEGLEEDGLEIKVKDIVVIGSNASYNYTSKSDIDVHIIADTSEMKDPLNVLPIVYNAYKSLFNDKHDVMINDHEIEVYVEINAVNAKSNGIYSLNTGWIKKPDINSIPDIDEDAFDKLFTQWEDRYFNIVGGEGEVSNGQN